MKDQFGHDMAVYAVSGSADPVSPTASDVNVRLTLLLKSRMEMKKVEVAYSVDRENRSVRAGQKDWDKFGEKWNCMQDAMLKLADGDRTVGKTFLREAMEAYDAKGKLNPSQIEEVMMGVFLVAGVKNL